jgi:hypothetical protein
MFGQKMPLQGALTGALTGALLTLDRQALKFLLFGGSALIKIYIKIKINSIYKGV